MRTFDNIGELELAVGSHLGYSEWHVITQEQINTFAQATGDHQWIHVDPDEASKGPFGATIAHGYLTLSLVPQLIWQIYDVKGIKMGVNYGAEKLRFPAPVPVDSKVRAGVELLSVMPMGDGHKVNALVTLEREGGDKPVCVVETVSILA